MAQAIVDQQELSRKGKLPCPDLEHLQQTNLKYGLGLSDDELLEYRVLINGSVEMFNRVALADESYVPPPSSRQFSKPSAEENSHNAWYMKCNIQDTFQGKLTGKRIAIKDNIAVAGIPMMNGSKILEGYVPEFDATVVQRILKAGGCIVGKTTCEDLCLSGGSFMTTYGPVRNPVNVEYSAGGSSSGSAVVVALGEADMAVGGDQGGSIRIPASSCGLVGLKPTHGLVPYTGAMPIVPCLDHLGPIGKTVADVALLLEVIAGHDDGRDYRQGNFSFQVPQYSRLIYPHYKSDKTIRLGIVKEGVLLCDVNVQEVFGEAIRKIRTCDHINVSELSMPMHSYANLVCTAISYPGTLECMFDGCGFGIGVGGLQYSSLASFLKDSYQAESEKICEVGKLSILLCDYLRDKAGPFHYASARTLGVKYRQEYDSLLNDVDVLLLPTLNKMPRKLPVGNSTLTRKINDCLDMTRNVDIFDVTGHPALTINSGFCFQDGLPVGIMIVGKHHEETTVLNVGALIEECFQAM